MSINIISFPIVFVLITALVSFGFVSFLFKDKKLTIIDLLSMSVIAGPAMLLSPIFLESLCGLKITTFLLVGNFSPLILINLGLILWLARNKRFKDVHILDGGTFVLLVIMAIIIFVRVFPIRNLIVPILADPISHSEWLKYLAENGKAINTAWYPQGFEYFLVYFKLLFNNEWAKIVLYGTNFCLALIPLSFYYFFRLQREKNYVLSISAVVLSSALIFPNLLFITAGKNSMIMAFCMVPLALFLIYRENDSPWDQLFLSLIIFGIFLVHYPTGFILYLLLATDYVYKLVARGGKRIVSYLKSSAVLSLTSALFLLASFLYVYPLYLKYPPSNDMSVAPVLEALKNNGRFLFATHDFFIKQTNLYGKAGIFLLLALVCSVALYIFNKKRRPHEVLGRLLIGSLATYLLLCVVLYKDAVVGLFLNIEAQFFCFFLIIIFLSWFIGFMRDFFHIKWADFAIIISLIVIFFAANYNSYIKYRLSANLYSMVMKEDLVAFDKINVLKIPNSDKVLIQMNNGAGFVSPVDGGSWLQVFTNQDAEVDFSEFTKPTAEDIYSNYIRLNKVRDEKLGLKNLYCKYGIRYIYWGEKQVYGAKIAKSMLDWNTSLIKIFDFGPALYKVQEIKCS